MDRDTQANRDRFARSFDLLTPMSPMTRMPSPAPNRPTVAAAGPEVERESGAVDIVKTSRATDRP